MLWIKTLDANNNEVSINLNNVIAIRPGDGSKSAIITTGRGSGDGPLILESKETPEEIRRKVKEALDAPIEF